MPDPLPESSNSPQEIVLPDPGQLHSRISMRLDLSKLQDRSPQEQEALVWLHGLIVNENLSWEEVKDATGYTRSVFNKIYNGKYGAQSLDAVVQAINSYRKLWERRTAIHRQTFVSNGVARMIHAGLDYAFASNTIATVIGESRQGKTVACESWAAANNHGRSVMVTAPPACGVSALLGTLAKGLGVTYSRESNWRMLEAIVRALNPNRILLVDDAHNLLPANPRASKATELEILRYVHDQTKCALVLIAAARFDSRLKSGEYQFEQIFGRVGMPIRLEKVLTADDVLPILQQYIQEPTAQLLREFITIANHPGRLGIVTEILRAASRVAAKREEAVNEHHIRDVMELREHMTGGNR